MPASPAGRLMRFSVRHWVIPVRTMIDRYLHDLRATLETKVGRQTAPALALNKIVLRREGQLLVAEFFGNLAGVLCLEPTVLGSIGAGSPIPMKPSTVIECRIGANEVAPALGRALCRPRFER